MGNTESRYQLKVPSKRDMAMFNLLAISQLPVDDDVHKYIRSLFAEVCKQGLPKLSSRAAEILERSWVQCLRSITPCDYGVFHHEIRSGFELFYHMKKTGVELDYLIELKYILLDSGDFVKWNNLGIITKNAMAELKKYSIAVLELTRDLDIF